MLATSRSRRKNAGQRMSDLINDEEDNEFYKNAYGGFEEGEEDNEFFVNEDEVEEDYVDSDFDIDENEDNKDNGDENIDEDEKSAKKKSVYKEPKPAAAKPKSQDEQPTRVKPVRVQTIVDTVVTVSDSGENKTLRNSTAIKRKELEERQKEREETKKTKDGLLKKNLENYRPTQEELLEEAYETEKINLASLDAYHKLELAKKKTKFVKTGIKGPSIRYHSTTMPLYNENPSNQADNSALKQTRNFVIFSDEATLKENFPKNESEPIVPQQKHCIITSLPAKYFDPVTQCPYANAYAYKILKDIYQKNQAAKQQTTKT